MMYSVEELLTLTENEVSSLNFGKEPHLLYEPIRYSMQEGGKRVRPLMLLLAANIFTDKIQPFFRTAIGVEMFHNFTLLHDDIMDNSPTRRGRDSVHRKWGCNVAILSGDAMLIYAYKLILETPSENLVKVLSVFNKLSLELCEGQQYDMDFEIRELVSMDEYINMICLKTSVLIAGAIEMGAVLGGASDDDCRKLYDFGLNIGIAFQLQDDILDAYADSATFGKPIGGDIIEGKKSYIFLLCYERANDDDKKLLLSTLNSNSLENSSKISIIKEIYNKYDIKRVAENDAEHYFHKATELLNKVSVNQERKDCILGYAKSLLVRIK